jgi:hypothetical protein
MYVPALTMIFASIPADIPPTLFNLYHDISKPEWNPVYMQKCTQGYRGRRDSNRKILLF